MRSAPSWCRGAGAYQIYFNCAKKPFDDARVRRACHLALSRQDLFEAFKTQEPLNYTRYMSHGFEFAMSPDDVLKQPGYRADKKEDIEQAKKLLAEAGLTDGLKSVVILTASVGPHAQTLTPATQAILKQNLGVESTIKAVERAVLNDERRAGQWDLSLNTIGMPLYDPTLGWIDYFQTGAANNLGKYAQPEVRRHAEEARLGAGRGEAEDDVPRDGGLPGSGVALDDDRVHQPPAHVEEVPEGDAVRAGAPLRGARPTRCGWTSSRPADRAVEQQRAKILDCSVA